MHEEATHAPRRPALRAPVPGSTPSKSCVSCSREVLSGNGGGAKVAVPEPCPAQGGR